MACQTEKIETDRVTVTFGGGEGEGEEEGNKECGGMVGWWARD